MLLGWVGSLTTKTKDRIDNRRASRSNGVFGLTPVERGAGSSRRQGRMKDVNLAGRSGGWSLRYHRGGIRVNALIWNRKLTVEPLTMG